VGGAVFGNAGAHGSDMSHNLKVAEILHLNRVNRVLSTDDATYLLRKEPVVDLPVENWSMEQCGFEYRSSIFKRQTVRGVVLAALLELEQSTPQAVQAKVDEYSSYRRRTQPQGASMGSMFKNPPGDHAGRLIEQVGLKGTRLGDAQISLLHGNFFINLGNATAADVYALIDLSRRKVYEKTGIQLELEIELLGEWEVEKTG
jgi:UDP-N-acetylmuramate dehydrogenase